MDKSTFEIEEGDRQMILLGLARMAIQRPGFADACREIAQTLKGEGMFEEFMRWNQPLTPQEKQLITGWHDIPKPPPFKPDRP